MSTRSERETERLLEKIRQAGAPVPDGARFEATHASRSMRVEGGAVWILVDAEGRPTDPLVCSQWPRRYLLARKMEAGQVGPGHATNRDWAIYPSSLH